MEMVFCPLLSSVPYQNPRLDVNMKTMTAVCTTQGGFPAPEIQWVLLYTSSHQSVESRNIQTTTMQNYHDRLYSSRSTLLIPAGPHEAVSCLIHNPTLNTTMRATDTFSKGMFGAIQWTEKSYTGDRGDLTNFTCNLHASTSSLEVTQHNICGSGFYFIKFNKMDSKNHISIFLAVRYFVFSNSDHFFCV